MSNQITSQGIRRSRNSRAMRTARPAGKYDHRHWWYPIAQRGGIGVRPVRPASRPHRRAGDSASSTYTGNAGPSARTRIAPASVRSTSHRHVVSASTPNALPSARTANTHGCDWYSPGFSSP
jgi:hypothetical protein